MKVSKGLSIAVINLSSQDELGGQLCCSAAPARLGTTYPSDTSHHIHGLRVTTKIFCMNKQKFWLENREQDLFTDLFLSQK